MFSIKSVKNLITFSRTNSSNRSQASTAYRSARSQASSYAPSVASKASTIKYSAAASLKSAFMAPKASRLSASSLSGLNDAQSTPDRLVANWLDQAQQPDSAAINKTLFRAPASIKNTPAEHLNAQARLLRATVKLGTWGSNLELVALARSLGVTLHIVKKDPGVSTRGALHNGQIQATINQGGGRPVYLTYDGMHYDALLLAQADGNGNVSGHLSPVPGDGDCMYHAVAAAGLRSFEAVPGLYATGALSLRLGHPVWQGVFAGEPNISDEDAFKVMRQAHMLQLRYDAAKELSKPQYSESAFLQEVANA
jgi:hypothetical protein